MHGLTGHPQVVAYAYKSKTIAILKLNTLITGNPATDNPVDGVTSLNLEATSEGYIRPINAYSQVKVNTA